MSDHIERTSSVMTKPSKASFTLKYVSGSFSFLKTSSTALLRRLMSASQRSSTSRSERKLPVVFKTWVSMMKYPTICSVIEGSEVNDNGSGIIKSDCA